MIKRFVRSNLLRLLFLAVLAAVNAGAAFVTLSAIGMIATRAVSITIIAGSVLLVLVLISSALLTQTISARLGADFVSALRENVAERLLTHPYKPVARHSTAGISAFINDIAEISPLARLAPVFAYNVLFAAVAAAYLFYVSAPLAALVIAQLTLLLSLFIVLLRPLTPAFNRLRATEDKLFYGIQCLEAGKKELLTSRHRATHFRRNIILPSIASARNEMQIAHSYSGRFQAWSSTTFYIVVLATVLLSSAFFPLPQAQLTSFMMGCLLLIAPINFMISSAQLLSRGVAAVKRIDRIAPENPSRLSYALSENTLHWDSLSLSNVEYVYDSFNEVESRVGPLSLSLRRGEVIFVVGGNGSGKSTLLLMLSGLLDPSSGEISVDALDMKEVREAYREQLSIVFCDFHIFDHLLDKDGDSAAAAAVQPRISQLGLDGVVEIADGKLSRTQASTGQRKRLALLQLLLENRDMMILDEIAADLDSEFKRYFYEDLLQEFRADGKTVVLATHDTEYFSCADRIWRMKDGQLLGAH